MSRQAPMNVTVGAVLPVTVIPKNLTATDWQAPRGPDEKTPDHYSFTPGSTFTFAEVLDKLFVKKESMVHWLNYYLSTNANRRGFCNGRENFLRRDDWNNKKIKQSQFYETAYDHFDLLTEDAKCNLICHPEKFNENYTCRCSCGCGEYRTENRDIAQNTKREEALKKAILENQLSKETWASLLRDRSIDVRARVLKLAATDHRFLSFFLQHDNFVSAAEINTLINCATSDDFRLGYTNSTVTLRQYIEFLNTLTTQNRLLFLRSRHPLNQSVWEQIPKWELLTVGDARSFFASRFEKEKARARNGASAPRVLQLPADNTPLASYLSSTNTVLTTKDFVAMRGEGTLEVTDFVRVQCDDFHFEAFCDFIRPFIESNDQQKINGVLACFFNFFMKNPAPFLKMVDQSLAQGGLLRELDQKSEIFQQVVIYARMALKNQAAKKSTSLTGDVAAHVESNDREKGYVHRGAAFVITTEGIAAGGVLSAADYDVLVESAIQAERRSDFAIAARDYCRALVLKHDEKIMEHTLALIAREKITFLYSVIESRVNDYVAPLFFSLNNDSVSAKQSLELLRKISDLFSQLALLNPLSVDRYNDFFVVLNKASCLHEPPENDADFYLLWKSAAALAVDARQKIHALFMCLRFASSVEERQSVKNDFEKYAKNKLIIKDAHELQQEQLVFELLIHSPEELITRLQTFFANSDVAETKRLLLALPVSLGNIEDYTSELMTLIEASVPFVMRGLSPAIFRERLLQLLKEVCIKQMREYQNDETVARAHFSELLKYNRPFTVVENALISEWLKKTSNESVKFILLGDENYLRQDLLHPAARSVQPEPASAKEAKKYTGLLMEMIAQGNGDAVLELVRRGADINQNMSTGHLMILTLMLNLRSQPAQMVSVMHQLLPRITDKTAQALFENIVFCIAKRGVPYASVVSLMVLNRLPEARRKVEFNHLLQEAINARCFDLVRVLVEEKGSLVDLALIDAQLDQARMAGDTQKTMCLLSALRSSFSTLSTEPAPLALHGKRRAANCDEIGDQELDLIRQYVHEAVVVPVTVTDDHRNKLAKTLALLVCAANSAPFAPMVTPLLQPLGVKAGPAYHELLRAADVERDAKRLQHSVDLFSRKHHEEVGRTGKTSLPNRALCVSDKEWLERVFDHGAHEIPGLFEHETGKRTRKTLEALGWMKEGRATGAAPITADDLRAYRSSKTGGRYDGWVDVAASSLCID